MRNRGRDLKVAVLFGALVVMLMGRPGRVCSARRLRVLLVVADLPTVVAVCGELVGLVSPSNMVRAIFGAPFGFAITWTLLRALTDGLWLLPESS